MRCAVGGGCGVGVGVWPGRGRGRGHEACGVWDAINGQKRIGGRTAGVGRHYRAGDTRNGQNQAEAKKIGLNTALERERGGSAIALPPCFCFFFGCFFWGERLG